MDSEPPRARSLRGLGGGIHRPPPPAGPHETSRSDKRLMPPAAAIAHSGYMDLGVSVERITGEGRPIKPGSEVYRSPTQLEIVTVVRCHPADPELFVGSIYLGDYVVVDGADGKTPGEASTMATDQLHKRLADLLRAGSQTTAER